MKKIISVTLLFITVFLLLVSCGSSVRIKPSYDDSSPQTEEATETDPGNTLATWDISRVDDYQADIFCDPSELLEKWMAVEGLTLEDLDARGCRQLVLVVLKRMTDYNTIVTCYEKNSKGEWAAVDGLTELSGTCGTNGVSHDRYAGDRTSPAGLYQLGTCFGNEGKPKGLKMPWRKITENSVWIGRRGEYYNTWQEVDEFEEFDTGSGEHLIEYTSSYALACVIRYNMKPYMVQGKGAAIFFHVSTTDTAGCIGLPYNDFRSCLLWLNKSKNPYILITGNTDK